MLCRFFDVSSGKGSSPVSSVGAPSRRGGSEESPSFLVVDLRLEEVDFLDDVEGEAVDFFDFEDDDDDPCFLVPALVFLFFLS